MAKTQAERDKLIRMLEMAWEDCGGNSALDEAVNELRRLWAIEDAQASDNGNG